ncbi:MAG: hypothetical protein K5765_00705 [Clostridia bacterium]|nr:hypothetical protein [Clostridia bacterium]
MLEFLKKLVGKSNKGSAIVVLFFTALFLFVTSVYAWFLLTDTATQGPVNGMTEYDPIVATYDVYYKNMNGDVISTDFDDDEISMHTYDSVFRYKNTDNPLVVRITIESEDLYNAASTDSDSTLTFIITRKVITGNNSNALASSLYFSSVMDFGMAIERSNFGTSTDLEGEDYYSEAYSQYFTNTSDTDPTPKFVDSVTSKTFVKDTTDKDSEKETTITFAMTYNKNDFKTIGEKTVLVYYLLVNYNQDVLEVGNHVAADFAEGLDLVATTFATDLDKITIKEGGL